MQQQVVLRENPPPLPDALRTQFREGGRRGRAAPPEHLLESYRVVDIYRGYCDDRCKEPPTHRPITCEGQLVAIHVQSSPGREHLLSVQQDPHHQLEVGYHGDAFQVAAVFDARLFPEAFRMTARARLHRRYLAQPRRIVIAHQQPRGTAAHLHAETSGRSGEDPSQLRAFAAPVVDLDGSRK